MSKKKASQVSSIDAKKIKRILIANRGEIAARIIRTAKKLNIETVAIYSDIDGNLPFVQMATHAVPLYKNTARETYLNIDRILEIAKEYKVDAIHPGYGFLSENAIFAEKVEEAEITFIGPSSFAIDAMGDKLKAKNLAEKAKVSTVPGYNGIINSDEEALKICKKIGLPVIIKAVAGGGGKGMRIVHNESDIIEAMRSAKREAMNAYANDEIFIEKFISEGRHIEIQILGDKHGNHVCLGERECSIQRFNQKVIEEAPSVFVDSVLREKMYAESIRLAKECNYYSAGTVEYIVDKDKNFYFMEMNTRLQVEHPVTEYTTGLDIVEQMILIAEGKELPFKQQDIVTRGHSIECRICAEDPYRNFLPSSGFITHYVEPEKEYNIRVESSIVEGSMVSQYYDSMVGKLISYGDTRNEAIDAMKKALANFEIEGIDTNIELLEAIVRHEDFISGNFSTSFVKKYYKNGFKGAELTDNIRKAFVVSGVVAFLARQRYLFSCNKIDSLIPRNVSYHKLHIMLGQLDYLVTISSYENDFIEITYHGESITFKHSYAYGDKAIRGIVDGVFDVTAKLKYLDSGAFLMTSGGVKEVVSVLEPHVFEYKKYIKSEQTIKKPKTLVSPITGSMTRLKVKEGDHIVEGQHILSIEAMKMENVILAESNAIVAKIHKSQGSSVARDEVILELRYEEA